MAKHFNTHTERLDIGFWHEFIRLHGKQLMFPKGRYLSVRGERTVALGFVTSGYFRYEVDNLNQKMIIGGFAFPAALVGDYPRCLYGERALLSIVAGEDAECYVMDASVIPAVCDVDSGLARQCRLTMESAYLSLSERHCNIYALSPKERYVELLRQHPQIIQNVPLREIASYLNISAIHLSRIRRELLLSTTHDTAGTPD